MATILCDPGNFIDARDPDRIVVYSRKELWKEDDTANNWDWVDILLDQDVDITNKQLLQGMRHILAQIDDLNAAVATMQQAVSDLQARDAQVVAGVQALQSEVSNLQAQVDAGGTVNLQPITDQVNALAASVATADTESTDIPTDPNAPPPAPTA